MCTKCGTSESAPVGTVVINTRRCSDRTINDHGKSIVGKLVYVTQIATRNEGVYGHVINEKTNKLQKTRVSIRDCEFKVTDYKWSNENGLVKDRVGI